MTDDTQKLDRFKNSVYAEAKSKADAILGQARKEKQTRLETAERHAAELKAAALSDADKEAQLRLTREASSAQLAAQKKVLLHREKIADKVFENVREELKKFRQSKEYGDWLVNAAKAAKKSFPQAGGTAYISPSDEKLAQRITSETGYKVEFKPTVLLGGITICPEGINVVFDSTFDTAVEEEREGFCKNAALTVEQKQ